MLRHLNITHKFTLKLAGLFWLLLQTSASSAQISSDLNRHIKTDDPTETIVYTALKKGFVSVKAEVKLVDGDLKSIGGLNFEDLYLRPLFDRYQENNGRIYKDYLGYFYLFIELKGDENLTMQALEVTLDSYEKMIAGFEWKRQRNPLKIVLINASPQSVSAITNNASSLISLEGDYALVDDDIHYTKMPVIGLNYELLETASLRRTAKMIHRKGKKLRIYNVPNNQALWGSLMDSGADFINSKKSYQPLLSKNN